MITIELNESNFEYDIHSLVKAFYPEHDVLVKEGSREDFPESMFHMRVAYDENEISIAFEQDGAEVLSGTVRVRPEDRKETKNQLKQRLYELLSEYSGQNLPWGTLTGIRPTKIPMAMLEEGKTDDEIRTYMKETYFASDAKIELALDVAKREMELLSRIDYEDGYSLYVGIPFCPSTCAYCSFTSYPLGRWASRMDEYLDALERELEFTAEACRDKYLNSIYIGGGTPTSLEPEQLERLITKIGECFHLFDANGNIVYGGLVQEDGTMMPGISAGFCIPDLSDIHPKNHLLEFTVEAGRPDSITEAKLQVLKKHNISRISINPQTMKEETLRIIGRRHTVQQTREAYALARKLGFDNINMDLIVGLPGESIEDVRRTMEELQTMQPDNITVHSLAIKRAARLRMQQEEFEAFTMENTWETIQLTADYCAQMGLEPYYLYRQKNMAGNFENVGYAAPGKAGVYNILIMEEKQTIMALGAGATTKVVFGHGERIERAGNVKDIINYLERIDEMIDRKRDLLQKTQADAVR